MAMQWLQPIAWWGLVVLVLPILIHLLVRQESRRLLFPSLRFLRTTALASWRRRFVSDWRLLIVRLLILASATAALAAPLMVSGPRREHWRQRVARAFVIAVPDGATRSATAVEADRLSGALQLERDASAFATTISTSGHVADALRDAVAWLQRQPLARREIVIAGEIRRGMVTEADLALVPPIVGIRFISMPAAPRTEAVTIHGVADNADGKPDGYAIRVTPRERSTEARYERGGAAGEWLEVLAPARDRRAADAAREATLAEGLINDQPDERRVTIVLAGGDRFQASDLTSPPAGSWMHDALDRLQGFRGGERLGRLVVIADVQATDPAAADVVATIARAALTSSRVSLEPFPIAAEQLSAWSRVPGPTDETALPEDQRDRRWLWAAALALLAVEHWMRRARERVTVVENDQSEARVA
jgi:hypothetical protein